MERLAANPTELSDVVWVRTFAKDAPSAPLSRVRSDSIKLAVTWGVMTVARPSGW